METRSSDHRGSKKTSGENRIPNARSPEILSAEVLLHPWWSEVCDKEPRLPEVIVSSVTIFSKFFIAIWLVRIWGMLFVREYSANANFMCSACGTLVLDMSVANANFTCRVRGAFRTHCCCWGAARIRLTLRFQKQILPYLRGSSDPVTPFGYRRSQSAATPVTSSFIIVTRQAG